MNFKEFHTKRKDQITEMRFEDKFGKGFLEFHAKYKKKGLKDDSSLYVNFHSDPDRFNFENKNPVSGNLSTHKDPTAIYAYPLKYVIDHPSDVRYGANAKFIRVLRKRDAASVLWLQHMNTWDQSNMIRKTKGEDWSSVYLAMKKIFPDMKSNENGLWFRAMQWQPESFDMMYEWLKEKKRNPYNTPKFEPKIMTSDEQAKMFLGLGYQAILDDAKRTSKAAINDWEPEQIAFLRRDAFEVIDMFQSDAGNANPKSFITNTSTEDEDKMYRKIAAGIAVHFILILC